jgi:autotransporter-associated beta strand protein
MKNILINAIGDGWEAYGPQVEGLEVEVGKNGSIDDAFQALKASQTFARPLRLIFSLLALLTVSQELRAQDITSQIEANQNVTLSGNATITLPGGTTTYTATTGLSGQGTLTVQGTGTLALDQINSYSLPTVGETVTGSGFYGSAYYTYEGYTSSAFRGYYYTIANPDPPAVTIDAGTTLLLGNTTTNGNIQNTSSGSGVNLDNILDNGLLEVENSNSFSSSTLLGEVSGSGNIDIKNAVAYMYGPSTFTGALAIENNMTLALGTDHVAASLPDASVIFDNGTLILDTPINSGSTVTQNIYEKHYGNDININGNGGLMTLTGQYSYTDTGTDYSPRLTNVADNYTFINGNASGRGINIEGGILQLGNGTGTNFFLPGNPFNTYINLHSNGILAFDYSNSGPAYLNSTIAGGNITFGSFTTVNGNPNAAGVGTVIVHQGDLVVTQQQYYNGTTQIDSGATLQLGDGTNGDMTGTVAAGNLHETSGGDGDIMQAGQTVTVGTTQGANQGTNTSSGLSTNNLINNGTLIVENVNATEFTNLSGSGRVIQAGAGTTTLLANTTYTGATQVNGGTLAVGSGGSIASSSGVDLEHSPSPLVAGPQNGNTASVVTPGLAVFDISQAGNQIIKDLSGSSGTTVKLGGNMLTVGTSHSTTYGGVIADGGIGGGSGGGVTKVGSGTFTVSGANTYTGPTNVDAGTFLIQNGSVTSLVTIKDGGTLAGVGTVAGVNLNPGGILAPGATNPGTLIASSLVWNGGGVIDTQLGDISDLLVVNGALEKGTGTGFLFNITDHNLLPNTSYTVIDFSSESGFALNASDFGSNLSSLGTFAFNGNSLQFDTNNLNAVPEPDTSMLLVLGGVVLWRARRRGPIAHGSCPSTDRARGKSWVRGSWRRCGQWRAWRG